MTDHWLEALQKDLHDQGMKIVKENAHCIFPVRKRGCKNKKTTNYNVGSTGVYWQLCKRHAKVCGVEKK